MLLTMSLGVTPEVGLGSLSSSVIKLVFPSIVRF